MPTLSVLLVFFLGVLHPSRADNIWIEAEKPSSSSQSVKPVKSAGLKVSLQESVAGKDAMRMSGLRSDGMDRTSANGYIECAPDLISSTSATQYEFETPRDGNYYVWIRISHSPPCFTYLDLLLDSSVKPDQPQRLQVDVFGIWLWWAWGGEYNTGKARSFRLSQGKHRITLYHSDPKLKIDKLLVTDDADYVPQGVDESFFTKTFEPLRITTVHKFGDMLMASATGWAASPSDRWSVILGPKADNHIYALSNCGNASGGSGFDPAYSYIKGMKYECFDMQLDLYFSAANPGIISDAIVLFGMTHQRCFDGLYFDGVRLDLFRYEEGARSAIKTVTCDMPKRDRPYSIRIRRGWTDLVVDVDGKPTLFSRMRYPSSGSMGVGGIIGGAAFDNFIINPLDNPQASFDFKKQDDPALKDWKLFSEDSARVSGARSGRRLLIYRIPGWVNSNITMSLSQSANGSVEVFYPYEGNGRYIETRLSQVSGVNAEVYSHSRGKCILLGKDVSARGSGSLTTLTLASTNGRFEVFGNGKPLIRCWESETLSGSIALVLGADDQVPVDSLDIRRLPVLLDDFLINSSGSLSPIWRAPKGMWRIVPLSCAKETYQHDGQLVAQGMGSLRIGEALWKSYSLQISVWFDEDTSVSLGGWADAESSTEALFDSRGVSIRKMAQGAAIRLERVSFLAKLSGWHTVGLDFADAGIFASVDGEERIQYAVPAHTGWAELRNYGECARFDDFQVKVLSVASETVQAPKCNPDLYETEKSLMR